jgi:hypothetical protein
VSDPQDDVTEGDVVARNNHPDPIYGSLVRPFFMWDAARTELLHSSADFCRIATYFGAGSQLL